MASSKLDILKDYQFTKEVPEKTASVTFLRIRKKTDAVPPGERVIPGITPVRLRVPLRGGEGIFVI